MTEQQINDKIDLYLHFWGIVLNEEEKTGLQTHLTPFARDEEELESEMICEIRTLIP